MAKATEMARRAMAGYDDPTAKAEAARAVGRARKLTPAEVDFLVMPEGLASDPSVSAAAKIVYAALLQLGPDARPRELAAVVGCAPKLLGPLFGELRRTGWLDYLLNGR